MPVHLEVQDEIVMNREEADLHWELILKKCISIHTSYQGREEGGGGKGTQQSVIWGGSALRSNPLPFHIQFLT